MSAEFYVYTHSILLDNGRKRPFYVGKGKGGRAYILKRNNRFHRNVVGKYGSEGVHVDLWSTDLTEQEAFSCERDLIAMLRGEGLSLANATDGGEGTSGYRHTLAAKEKCRLAASGLNNPFYGKKRPEHADKLRGKARPDQSNRMRGCNHPFFGVHGEANPNYGRKNSEQTIQKMRESARANSHLIRARMTGVPKTDEHRYKMRLAAIGRVWINKDGIHTHVKPEKVQEMLQLGWNLGRK